jgi:hypothetical protein
MWSILLVSLLATTPSPETLRAFPQIAAEVQTGTLIFSQGDCLAVKVFTQSPYTHVGVVVCDGDSRWVYDAMNGPGVRKTPLEDYLRFLVPSDVHLLHPRLAFTETDQSALRKHLDSQLGRPYRIRHHVTGQRCDGVHCAEYVMDSLMAAQRMSAAEPPRVSPGSLLQGAISSRVYMAGGRYAFHERLPEPPPQETWCQRNCRETNECCTALCRQLSRWFLCREKLQ